MSTLRIPITGVYFDQIANGEKLEEYRECKPHWKSRIEGRHYEWIELTVGYPKTGVIARRLIRPWQGYTIKEITHPHFGPGPVRVYAIPVN